MRNVAYEQKESESLPSLRTSSLASSSCSITLFCKAQLLRGRSIPPRSNRLFSIPRHDLPAICLGSIAVAALGLHKLSSPTSHVLSHNRLLGKPYT